MHFRFTFPVRGLRGLRDVEKKNRNYYEFFFWQVESRTFVHFRSPVAQAPRACAWHLQSQTSSWQDHLRQCSSDHCRRRVCAECRARRTTMHWHAVVCSFRPAGSHVFIRPVVLPVVEPVGLPVSWVMSCTGYAVSYVIAYPYKLLHY